MASYIPRGLEKLTPTQTRNSQLHISKGGSSLRAACPRVRLPQTRKRQLTLEGNGAPDAPGHVPASPDPAPAHRPACARQSPGRRAGDARSPPATPPAAPRRPSASPPSAPPRPRTCTPRWAARPGSGAHAAAPAWAPPLASPAARSASEAAPAASWRRQGPGAWTRRRRR